MDVKTTRELLEEGRSQREKASIESHAEWSAAAGRADPVELLDSQNATRLGWLVPVRHGRMMASPFAFYRGGAKVMANDLAGSPDSGIAAQICGDAHLANFGFFGSPERELVFDVNDFDETLPGPWEWDVKRMAASFVIASRHNGHSAKRARRAARRSVEAYRKAMARFSEAAFMDIWYAQLRAQNLEQFAENKKQLKRYRKSTSKIRSKGSQHAFDRLVEEVDGELRIKNNPPLLHSMRGLAVDTEALQNEVIQTFVSYLESVPDRMKAIFSRYRGHDLGIKVVGVGSAGTRCMILVMTGREHGDPLFLQLKEASRSVLEDHLPASPYANHGQRVVEGQSLMQASSDIFLGWTESPSGYHFYIRQLKDMKGSPEIETYSPKGMRRFAGLCGWTLAKAHARTTPASRIYGYMGDDDRFDRALGVFAEKYADQNEHDYQLFLDAIKSGRIEAEKQ